MAARRIGSQAKVRRMKPERETPPLRAAGEADPPAGDCNGLDLRGGIEKMRRIEDLVNRLLWRLGGGDDAGQTRGAPDSGADSESRMTALARRVLLTKAVEAAVDLSGDAMKALSPDQLARMISRFEETRIASDRLRLQWTKGVEAAKEAIIERLEEELREQPELMASIRGVIDSAAGNVSDEAEDA
ncbi:MAG: hypothetical protein V3V62_14525 [bacterium]